MVEKPRSGGGEDDGEIAGVLASEEGIWIRVSIEGIVRIISGCGGGREIEKGFTGASGNGGG